MRTIHSDTIFSIRSLGTIGRFQLNAAGGLALRVLLANRDLYGSSTHKELEKLLEFAERKGLYTPFRKLERSSNGSWTRPFGPGTTYEMTFFQRGGARIDGDVFDLESYVEGPRIAHEMSFEEMRRSPSKRNTWTVTWDEPGPLHHLLAQGGDLPNPFVIHASLRDLARLAAGAGIPKKADLGPLAALLELRVESTVQLDVRTKRGVEVEFRADAERRSVRSLVRTGRLPYRVEDVRASEGPFRLRADTASLDARPAGLTGRIEFDVAGPNPAITSVSTLFPEKGEIASDWTCNPKK